jgi:4-amino-4-deoxy-L-arabinose transferase-like glycosyltransferase
MAIEEVLDHRTGPGPRRVPQTWVTRAATRWMLGLLVVVLLALVLRLAALAATHPLPLTNDPADYSRVALSIAHGHGYPPSDVVPVGGPSAFRPPGFPFFLAGIYKISGESVTVARAVQALLGAAIVALEALIALELWGPTVGLVAGFLAAIFPPLIIDGITLLSEPLFVTLVLAAVLSSLRWRRSGRVPWLVAAGALTGLAILTRQNAELLVIPLLFAARRNSSWRHLRTYRAPAALLACTVVVVLPWTIRNAVDLHGFVPVSDQDGYTLAGTYNATSQAQNGAWITAKEDPTVDATITRYGRQGELALDSRLRSQAVNFALDHPGYLFNVALHNTLRLFNLGGTQYETGVVRGEDNLGRDWGRLMTLGLFPFLVLAVAGLFTRAARRAPRWFWAVPIVMLPAIMVLASNRIRAPIDPFLLILGALALTELVPRAVRRKIQFSWTGRRRLHRLRLVRSTA